MTVWLDAESPVNAYPESEEQKRAEGLFLRNRVELFFLSTLNNVETHHVFKYGLFFVTYSFCTLRLHPAGLF